MIKSKNGTVVLKGDLEIVLADYSLVTRHLVKVLVEEGIEKEEAKKLAKKAFEVCLLSREEIKKEVDKKVAAVLEEVAECIKKDLAEGEQHE